MNYLYSLICFLFITHQLQAQIKYEKESRLTIADIPEQAKDFVFELIPSKKIKWYKEESLNSESIEAKTCYNKKKYSIEFNTEGLLEDVEIVTKFKDLEPSAKSNIIEHLESNYSKYKIKKIQIQYSGTETNVLSYFKTDERNTITIKYEMVLKGKTDQGMQLYELLFSEIGILEKKSQIVFRNTDNIEF